MSARLRERTRAHARLIDLARARFAAAVPSLAPLRGDASDRTYVRLAHPGGARATSVGMILPEAFAAAALPFLNVQRHLREVGVRVPEVFAMDEGAGVILLEDCGAESLEDVWRRGGWAAARPFYGAALDAMAAMQEAPPGDARGRVALARRFSPSFFTAELHHAREHAFENLLGMRTDARLLDGLFRELSEEACRQPFRLTHRDYHSRNLMAGTSLFVIDFQDARMGPVLYDLASLAFDSYAALDAAARARLIDGYWETCGRRHFSDKEEYERALRATAIQRNLKAIGTFAYQKAARGADRYLENIPHTVRMVQEHFERRSDLAHVHDPLKRFLEALAP